MTVGEMRGQDSGMKSTKENKKGVKNEDLRK
jgi:hypothetical protein